MVFGKKPGRRKYERRKNGGGGEHSVLFVQPANPEEKSHFLCPPYWVAILKALTPPNWETGYINMGFETLTEKDVADFDVVAIGIVSTSTAYEAYRVGDMAMESGAHVVMGGLHTFIFPDEARPHCHTIIVGEGEGAWREFLADFERGRPSPLYVGGVVPPERFVVPDFSITKKYFHHHPVVLETMRGCPFNCAFCTATPYSGNTYRYFPAEIIHGTIERWCEGRKMPVRLANTNILGNVEKTREVLKIFSDHDFYWWGPCSTNLVRHDDLFPLLAESGCTNLRFGFESVSPKTLRYLNKKQNVVSEYKRLVKKVHDHGITVGGNFMFGLDTDTPEVFRATEEFINDADIDVPLIGVLIPFPGTRIFDEFHAQGRILTYDWSKYNGQHLVYRPKNMTKEQLLRGVLELYENVHTPARILSRLTNSRPGIHAVMGGIMAGVLVVGKRVLQGFFEKAIEEEFENPGKLLYPPNRSFARFVAETRHA